VKTTATVGFITVLLLFAMSAYARIGEAEKQIAAQLLAPGLSDAALFFLAFLGVTGNLPFARDGGRQLDSRAHGENSRV
jgi:hypothetical protein